jgi:integrase
MSVQRHRENWRVRWREGGRQRSRTFDRKRDAETFDREVKRRLQLGPHLMRELERNQQTLAQFVDGGFRVYVDTLTPKAQAHYQWALDHHLRELADEPLSALDVPRLKRHQQHLLESGRTLNTIRAAMAKLSGILQIAAEDGLITGNPVRTMRKLPAPPRNEVRPFAPVELERLIDAFTGRGRIIVVLGAHLGLRPIEMRLVTWDGFTGDTLTIRPDQTKKSAARTRTIAVPKETARELRAWRLESGGRDSDTIVGGELTEETLRQWAYQHLKPAAKRITGRTDVVTYTLRHSHASVLHYAGFTVPEAAKRMGHSAVKHLDTYAHVIEAISGRRYADLDALIADARAQRGTLGLECPESAPNRA